jgi:hypothetical protein
MHSKHSGNKQQDGHTHDLTRTQLQPYKFEVVDGREIFLICFILCFIPDNKSLSKPTGCITKTSRLMLFNERIGFYSGYNTKRA